MAKKKPSELENYFAPVADEANKGWKHLVEYCLDQYHKSRDSKYRDKKIKEIKHTVEVYAQDEKHTLLPPIVKNPGANGGAQHLSGHRV